MFPLQHTSLLGFYIVWLLFGIITITILYLLIKESVKNKQLETNLVLLIIPFLLFNVLSAIIFFNKIPFTLQEQYKITGYSNARTYQVENSKTKEKDEWDISIFNSPCIRQIGETVTYHVKGYKLPKTNSLRLIEKESYTTKQP